MTAPSRYRAAVELSVFITGVLAIMWIVPLLRRPNPTKDVLILALLAVLLSCHLRDQVGWRELGFRSDNLLSVLRRLTPVFGGLVLGAISIGLVAGTLRFGTKTWVSLALLPAWALLQQYMLFAFAHRRLRVVLGPGQRCIWATTVLFAVMHLPNPTLTLVCALGGYAWAREYERSPNLFAHAVTHTVGSVVLLHSLPRELLKNMVVGYRYFLN